MTLDRPLDADVPIRDDVLAHAGALRRLACGVVGADEADDVVQETWVVALQRAPSRPRALGAWLATVARRLALRRMRGGSRRVARERDAAEAARPIGADDTAARRAALSALTHAVLALEEPYQTAILLRFYDDLPPRAVAARTGVPLATAKSRIARGLARLRERLERDLEEHEGGLRGALSFLIGPASLAAGPAGDAGPAAGGPAAAGAAAATAGAIAMGVQVKAVIGVAAAVVLGAVAWRGLAREAAEPAAPRVAHRAQAVARPDDLALPGDFDAPAAVAAAREEDARAPVAGHGAAWEDATIALAPDPYAYEIEGVALDPDDLPAAEAEVLCGPLGAPLNTAGKTDGDGRFRVRFHAPAPALDLVLRVRRHGHDSGLRRLRLPAGTSRVALQLREGPGPQPLPRPEGESEDGSLWRLALEPTAEEGVFATRVVLGGGDWHPDFAADAAGRGRFALFVDRCPAHGAESFFAYQFESVNVSFSTALHEDVARRIAGLEPPEPPPASVRGVVRDAAGRPVEGALVALGTRPGRGDGPRTTTGEDGRYAFPLDLEPRSWYLRAGGGDLGLDDGAVLVRAGVPAVFDAELDRGQEIRGRVVDAETGAPIAGALVLARAEEREDAAVTGEDGAFAIPNLPRRAFDVLARAPGAPIGAEALVARAVVPGGEAVALALPRDVARGVALRVQREDGRPASASVARLWNLETGAGLALAPLAGWMGVADLLPAGVYEIEVLVPDREPLVVGPLALGGPPSDDPVTAESADVGGVAGLAAHGELLIRDRTDARSAERWVTRLWRIERGARLLVLEERGPLPERLALAPGRFELDLEPDRAHADVAARLARGEALEGRRLAFEIRPDETLRIGVRRDMTAAAAGPLGPEPPEEPPAPSASPPEEALLVVSDGLSGTIVLEDLVARRRCAACH